MTGNERRIVLGAVVALAMTCARGAAADGASTIVAEQLFTSGRALLEVGQVDAACPKLAESQRLEPAGGTVLLLGICFERQGRFASAWATLLSARATAHRDGRQDRIEVAEEHLQAITPRLAHLTVRGPSAAEVPGIEIFLDGVALGEARDLPIPVDPGPHDVRATAPGHVAYSNTVVIPVGNGSTLVVVGSIAAVPPVAPSAPIAMVAPTTTSPRIVPLLTVGALGVIALGATAYFGVQALNYENEKPSTCLSADSSCLASRQSLETQRGTDARIATIAGTASVAAALGAIVLLALPHRTTTPDQAWNVTPFGLAGAALSVTF